MIQFENAGSALRKSNKYNPRNLPWVFIEGLTGKEEFMNKGIMRAMGLNKEVEMVENNICPFCNKPIKVEDFKDNLSRKEYRISGLCQKCQDKTFN